MNSAEIRTLIAAAVADAFKQNTQSFVARFELQEKRLDDHDSRLDTHDSKINDLQAEVLTLKAQIRTLTSTTSTIASSAALIFSRGEVSAEADGKLRNTREIRSWIGAK